MVILGLVLGNFLHQIGGGRNWMLALERSWFQLVAVLIYAMVMWYDGRMEQ